MATIHCKMCSCDNYSKLILPFREIVPSFLLGIFKDNLPLVGCAQSSGNTIMYDNCSFCGRIVQGTIKILHDGKYSGGR